MDNVWQLPAFQENVYQNMVTVLGDEDDVWQLPLTVLCSMARCFSSRLTEFGRLGPLANVGFFYGLWLTTNVGQQIDWLNVV
jgi:hypothetical protein